MDNINPATGKSYSKTPNSSLADLDKAVESGKKAFSEWSKMSITKRSRVLLRLADLIDQNLEELAVAESTDTSKPLSLARRVDIPRAAANFRFFGSSIVNFASESHLMEGVAVNYTRRAPLGIVGCISPWNLPLYLFTWKIAPALAMGNCVIGKPSELTPYTAYLLGSLAAEAGIPAGVLNILHGEGKVIGQAIVEHPDIKAISFTGGTATGKMIGQAAAAQFKKVSLELGGKNPTLIFADCQLEDVIKEVVASAFTNQGEICLCGSRILVEESIFEEFSNRFVEEVSKLKVGDPMHQDTDLGALISKDHQQKVLKYIDLAIEEGGKILTGGNVREVKNLDGYFVEPTVITALDQSCRVNQEEIFGPVVTLSAFQTEKDALTMANASQYGLSASLWTKDVTKAHRLSHALQAGIVWVNCWMLRDLRTPFGGMKQSGLGREGGVEALRFFSESQNICIRI
ncbi:MAG: aldehyde dehydrogenase [Cyclobacteriaceae bacterium]|nr:aldehyde dehydrogenase [Cyclobacteriaceae bacterium HetDA_MAG_MS6]